MNRSHSKKLRLITASLLISALNLYGNIDPAGTTININPGVLPAEYGYAANGLSAFFSSNIAVVGQNGVIHEFGTYLVQTNYVVLDPYEDTSFYIKIGTFGNSEVGVWARENSYNGMGWYGGPVGTPTSISPGTDYTFSEGLSMGVGNWISTNSSFFSTNNSSKVFIEVADSDVDPIFGDDIYFYMPPSAYTSTDTNNTAETDIELSYENLIIPFRTSKIETRIYNLYGETLQDYLKESVDYDTDVECVIYFNSPDIREIAEASINLEGAAGTDYGVLEFEFKVRENYCSLDFEVSDDILPNGHTFEDIHIQAQLNHADNMYSIDILPNSLAVDSIPDQADCITMLRFSPELDHIEFLYDESEEFYFQYNDGNWSLSGSTTPQMSGENFITNNAHTYCVISNQSYEIDESNNNISFVSLKLEASIEANEDSEGNEITPTTPHPFSEGLGYNPTNLLGVSYLNVLENKTDLKVAVTNLPFELELPYDFQYDRGLDYLNNSDLVVNYFDGTYSNGFGLNGLYVMGTSEHYVNTNVLAENTTAYSNYNSRIQNGTLARDPLNDINAALTEITEGYFNDAFTGTNGFDQASIVEGDLRYQNGLLIKDFDFSIPDFEGINYTGTFSTVLSDSDVVILESWFHADYVTQTSAHELLQSISAIQATGSNFVYRFDPPESNSAVTLDWTINFAETLPNWGEADPNYYNSNGYQRIHHLYTLPNDRLLCIYNAETNDTDSMYGFDAYPSGMNRTNDIGVCVLSATGSPEYSYFENYIPYSATLGGTGRESNYDYQKHIVAKNLGGGAFGLSFNFTDNQMSKGSYYVVYYPTNNTYERIVFDGSNFPNSAGDSNTPIPLLETSWAAHDLTVYTFDDYKQNLSKYSLDLPHLATSISTGSGTNQSPDLSSITARVNQLESDVPALENSLISYADASDSSLSNSLIAQIDASISGFSNSVDWASISSVDTNEINSRIDGISYINTLLANEVSQEIQNRSTAIDALQEEINILSGIVNNATNTPGAVSIEQAKSMMRDLRVGSSIIDVSNQQATITISLDQSSDLTSNWTENVMSAPMTIDTEDTSVQFYRIRMD